MVIKIGVFDGYNTIGKVSKDLNAPLHFQFDAIYRKAYKFLL
jgi:hypothetical protein